MNQIKICKKCVMDRNGWCPGIRCAAGHGGATQFTSDLLNVWEDCSKGVKIMYMM